MKKLLSRRGAVVKDLEDVSTNLLVHIRGVAQVRVPLVGRYVGRDLNLQKLHYQYLTTSVAVVLVVR